MWADDENAMTRAEAQAFKRACSCFGLGRYFYDFAEMWVDLDEYGNPKSIPNLPAWALPPGIDEGRGKAGRAPTDRAPSTKAVQAAKSNVWPIDEPLDPKRNREIEEFRRRSETRFLLKSSQKAALQERHSAGYLTNSKQCSLGSTAFAHSPRRSPSMSSMRCSIDITWSL